MNIEDLSESEICDKFIRPAKEAAGWELSQGLAARQAIQSHLADALIDTVA